MSSSQEASISWIPWTNDKQCACPKYVYDKKTKSMHRYDDLARNVPELEFSTDSKHTSILEQFCCDSYM